MNIVPNVIKKCVDDVMNSVAPHCALTLNFLNLSQSVLMAGKSLLKLMPWSDDI